MFSSWLEILLWNICFVVHVHLSVSFSMQVEQLKSDTDLDQDADLAYNSLKVRFLNSHPVEDG